MMGIFSRQSARPARVSPSSRRAFLRASGIAVAAGLAGTVSAALGGLPKAQAADSDTLLLGAANDAHNQASTPTTLSVAASATPHNLLIADDTAEINGAAILGIGSGPSSIGVIGQSLGGYGVVGDANGGIDLWIGGTAGGGRALWNPQPTPGAPTYTAMLGEQIRDANGELWLCTAGGSPATWVRAATVMNNYVGGSVHFLLNPIRVIDTRGNGAPITNGGSALAGNSTLVAQITGASVGGIAVPDGAIALIGNLTAIPFAPGDLTIWADGLPRPNVSNLNYASANVANAVTARLSSAGKVDIFAHNGRAHVILDITGFIK